MLNLVQELILQVDSKKLLEQYLLLAIPTVLQSLEEIAIKTIDDEARKYESLNSPSWYGNSKNCYPVIRISGYYFPKDKENSYFNGYKPWEIINHNSRSSINDSSIIVNVATMRIIEILTKCEDQWKSQFLLKKGDGFNSGFNKRDGSIEVGYQITNFETSPAELTVSLTHIYYGK
jgi:hypothetical protein